MLASKCDLEHNTFFLRGKEQLSLKEKVETRNTASIRIHVERELNGEKIKNYRILQGVLHTVGDEIWYIHGILKIFLPALVL